MDKVGDFIYGASGALEVITEVTMIDTPGWGIVPGKDGQPGIRKYTGQVRYVAIKSRLVTDPSSPTVTTPKLAFA